MEAHLGDPFEVRSACPAAPEDGIPVSFSSPGRSYRSRHHVRFPDHGGGPQLPAPSEKIYLGLYRDKMTAQWAASPPRRRRPSLAAQLPPLDLEPPGAYGPASPRAEGAAASLASPLAVPSPRASSLRPPRAPPEVAGAATVKLGSWDREREERWKLGDLYDQLRAEEDKKDAELEEVERLLGTAKVGKRRGAPPPPRDAPRGALQPGLRRQAGSQADEKESSVNPDRRNQKSDVELRKYEARQSSRLFEMLTDRDAATVAAARGTGGERQLPERVEGIPVVNIKELPALWHLQG